MWEPTDDARFRHRASDLLLIAAPIMCILAAVLVSEIDSKFAALECDKVAFMPNDLLTGSALLDRARKIKIFLMDIDATLTDGGVCLISPLNNGYDRLFGHVGYKSPPRGLAPSRIFLRV
jgi:hypothetical protein